MSERERTNEEIICEWMEPRPKRKPNSLGTRYSEGRFWEYHWFFDAGQGWVSVPLTLDRLRLVEERLTEEQWREYSSLMWMAVPRPIADGDIYKAMLHASAEQKICALAETLKGASK